MDVLGLSSLVIAVTVAIGVLLKECGCLSSIKKFHGNCSRCCDVELETKSGSPRGASSGAFNSINKLNNFIEEKKHEAEKVRLELIKKLECVLADLKGETPIEPKQDFDHTFIYIYESDWRRNFEYRKKFVNNTKLEYEYNTSKARNSLPDLLYLNFLLNI